MKPKLLVTAIGAFLVSLGLAFAAAPFLGFHLSGGIASHLWYMRQIRAYIVQSGSMAPAISVGSLVVTLPQSTYQSTDMVTFATDPKGKDVTTHRVAFKTYPEGPHSAPVYITKGDKNEEVDTARITDQNIVGKVFLTIPYIGYAAVFVKEPRGFILLVIVPATIIIYEELKTLARELKRAFGSIKSRLRQRRNIEFQEVPGRHREFPKMAVVIPIFAATLLVLSATSAFFADKENSLGNIFSAASSYISPPPIAQTLVINEVLPDTSCMVGQNKEAQWLEVYNGYSTTVNLKNFSITDGSNTIDLVTSNTNLPAGQVALIGHDNATWTQCYTNTGTTIKANFGGGDFNIDTGQLQLLDPSDVVIDTVQWGSALLNPTQDQSIERDPDGKDSATGINFDPNDFTVRTTPQPGL